MSANFLFLLLKSAIVKKKKKMNKQNTQTKVFNDCITAKPNVVIYKEAGISDLISFHSYSIFKQFVLIS
jgi:hypothetical protein